MSITIVFLSGAIIALVIANNTTKTLDLLSKAWKWIKSKF